MARRVGSERARKTASSRCDESLTMKLIVAGHTTRCQRQLNTSRDRLFLSFWYLFRYFCGLPDGPFLFNLAYQWRALQGLAARLRRAAKGGERVGGHPRAPGHGTASPGTPCRAIQRFVHQPATDFPEYASGEAASIYPS